MHGVQCVVLLRFLAQLLLLLMVVVLVLHLLYGNHYCSGRSSVLSAKQNECCE